MSDAAVDLIHTFSALSRGERSHSADGQCFHSR